MILILKDIFTEYNYFTTYNSLLGFKTPSFKTIMGPIKVNKQSIDFLLLPILGLLDSKMILFLFLNFSQKYKMFVNE